MRKSKWNALSWVFLVLLAACEGFFAAVIVKLDMLPAKYGFLLLGIVVLRPSWLSPRPENGRRTSASDAGW